MNEQAVINPVSISQNAQAGAARMKNLTSEQRHELASKAAKARWSNRNKKIGDILQSSTLSCRALNDKSVSTRNKTRRHLRQSGNNKVFGVALSAAEKRLAKAIEERAKAANLWAVLNAEIPSLQQTIAALRNQQTAIASLSDNLPNRLEANQPDLAAIVSDSPLPAVIQPNSIQNVIHPPRASRARGAAVSANLGDNEDENKFLNDSDVASGEWH